MRASVIVWDLETVPDLGGFAAANDLVGKFDVEVREAIGDKFPKHIYHSIALIAHRECDHWAVDALGFGLYLCRAGFTYAEQGFLFRFYTGTNAGPQNGCQR
jgi:hypothetical protein